MKTIKVDIHVHTGFSSCSNLTSEKIFKACKEQNISTIAITDHNTIKGAQSLKATENLDLEIIIGEEISTKDGEIIAYFINSHIDGYGKSAESVIHEIKNQGGISMIPHPFDKIRKETLNNTVLNKLKNKIDIIEIFNSRCILKKFNDEAKRFAEEENIIQAVGSDAHFESEIGKATIVLPRFNSPKQFLTSLEKGNLKTQYSPLPVHLSSKFYKIYSRINTKWSKQS